MNKPLEIFKTYCRKNAMRFTPERAVIIEEIYKLKGHFDVDNLFIKIRTRRPQLKLARGSIYRTIPHLIACGLIREALNDEGKICYECSLGHNHHDHLKCVKCGRVFEFYEKAIDEKQEKLCEKMGFAMLSHVHVIQGICARCQRKKKVDD